MNKQCKASFLAFLFCLPTLYTSSTQAFDWRVEASGENALVGLGVVTGIVAVGCGIGALFSAFTWSDNDIYKWSKQGFEDIELKYQQLNQYHGSLMARLQLFGNRNTTSSSFWKTDIDNIAVNNRALAPLHNTIIIINEDRDQLKKYYSYLMRRNLHATPHGKRLCEEIITLLNDFENLSNVILSSPEYTGEEQALHQKLHQLQQERLQRERNEALEAQARSQRERARADREQADAQRELARSQKEQARAQRELARAQEDLAHAQRRNNNNQPTIIIVNEGNEDDAPRPAAAAPARKRHQHDDIRDMEIVFDY